MPRAVLDPNVLVSAFNTPAGASSQLLLKLLAGAFELVTSPKLLHELNEVLKRKRFSRYASVAEVDQYVEFIRRESLVLDDPVKATPPLSADPDDQYLVDLGRSARVDAIVSGDSHVLELRDVIPAMTPREFLQSLG